MILLLQQTQQVPLNCITLIDPYFDGGDLARKWGSVISNTPWSKTIDAFNRFLPSFPLPQWALDLPLDLPTPLCKIAQLSREMLVSLIPKLTVIQGQVTEVDWISNEWSITVRKYTGLTVYKANALCFTQGSIPKTLNLPIPSIPLEIALNPKLLPQYVHPGQNVIVFGTMHSGTLILKNLVDCSAQRIIGFYKGSTPFRYSRDGVYDGIKLDAATIADAISAGIYPSVQCISLDDISALIRESQRANWVVYAIGFEPREFIIKKEGQPVADKNTYDGATGACKTLTNAWGFGIAYPNQAPDGIHWDVGIYSFLEHMNAQIPSILSALV